MRSAKSRRKSCCAACRQSVSNGRFRGIGGQRARPLAGAQAAEQAVQVGAPVRYDEAAQAPHYNFWRGGTEQEVWLEDARSYRAKCALAAEYRLGGVAVPEAAQWYSQLWGIL